MTSYIVGTTVYLVGSWWWTVFIFLALARGCGVRNRDVQPQARREGKTRGGGRCARSPSARRRRTAGTTSRTQTTRNDDMTPVDILVIVLCVVVVSAVAAGTVIRKIKGKPSSLLGLCPLFCGMSSALRRARHAKQTVRCRRKRYDGQRGTCLRGATVTVVQAARTRSIRTNASETRGDALPVRCARLFAGRGKSGGTAGFMRTQPT